MFSKQEGSIFFFAVWKSFGRGGTPARLQIQSSSARSISNAASTSSNAASTTSDAASTDQMLLKRLEEMDKRIAIMTSSISSSSRDSNGGFDKSSNSTKTPPALRKCLNVNCDVEFPGGLRRQLCRVCFKKCKRKGRP